MTTRMWQELQENRFPDETPFNPPRAWNAYRRRDKDRQNMQVWCLEASNQDLRKENEELGAELEA